MLRGVSRVPLAILDCNHRVLPPPCILLLRVVVVVVHQDRRRRALWVL